jgi:predicted kinase
MAVYYQFLLKSRNFMRGQRIFTSFVIYLFFAIKTATIYAFDVEHVKNEISVQLATNLKASSKDKPILILVGGYPGAGKTTLINALHQIYDFDVISWNSIRQELLDRHLKGSPYDREIIKAVNHTLFKNCIHRSVNVVIDANAHGNNIMLFENLLDCENAKDKYQLIKICLNPPCDILMNRILAREQNEDVHQGTEADLKRDLNSKSKKLNMNDYSLIIKNDKDIDFERELNIVISFLKPYFDNQSH